MTSRNGRGFEEGVTTVERPRLARSMPGAAFRLVVGTGPERGKSLLIDSRRVSRALVGQSPACELVVTDPLVSRRHAAFEISGARLQMTDLGSTNGTRVNDVAVN